MDEIIKSARIKAIRNICLEEETNVGYIDHFFNFLVNNSDMKIDFLSLKKNYLGILPVNTLASTLCQVRSTKLNSSMKITLDQVEAILQTIDLGCRLKKLTVGYWKELKRIDLGPLLKLQELELLLGPNMEWHPRTLQKFCKSIAKSPESDLKLKHLSFECNNLSSLDPSLLASAFSKMESINLSLTCLTSTQLSQIFSSIAKESKLRRNLSLEGNDLSELNDECFAKAACEFITLNTSSTRLNATQLHSLISAIAGNSKSKIKNLALRCNDLSSVDSIIISAAFCKLKELNLSQCNLSAQQVENFFEKMKNEKISKLNNLSLEFNNLSTVAPKTLTDGLHPTQPPLLAPLPSTRTHKSCTLPPLPLHPGLTESSSSSFTL